MTRSIKDKISQVESLLQDWKHKEALELLKKITARKGLPTDNRFVCTLLESKARSEVSPRN